VRLGFLSQEQELDNSRTILDNVFSADSPKTRAIADYEKAVESHDEKAMERAHDAMDRNNAAGIMKRAHERCWVSWTFTIWIEWLAHLAVGKSAE
jgi:ATPase subunit of ABC transporter with duplicated ATPase domains